MERDIVAEEESQRTIKETSEEWSQKANGSAKIAEYCKKMHNVIDTERETANWTRHIEQLCLDYFSKDYDLQYKDLDFLVEGIYYTAYVEDNDLVRDYPAAAPSTLNNINRNIRRCNADANDPFSSIKSIPTVVRDKVEKVMQDKVNKGNFCMRLGLNFDMLNDIIHSHFKNCFETGENAAYLSRRRSTAKLVFGFEGEISNANREKYGYLSSCPILDSRDEGDVNIYGMVRVTFDKEKVLNKTTLTIGDSVMNRTDLVASKAAAPKAESIPGVINKNPFLLASIYSSGKLDLEQLNSQCFQYKVTDFKKDTNDVGEKWFNNIFRESIKKESYKGWQYKKPVGGGSPFNPNLKYIELQYHGPLTIDDVMHIDVERQSVLDERDDQKISELQKELETKNINVKLVE